MPISIQATQTSFNQEVRGLAKSDTKKEDGPIDPEVSKLAREKDTAQKQLNAAILESTISISAADSPQALILKTALEGINEALSATLGGNAIQNAYDSGLDVSPGATADRIVSLSTAFFSQYQTVHTEFSDDVNAARAAFTEVIRGGIEKGFAEAREILGGLNVLDGDIASNIDKTYDLVQKKLNDFANLVNELVAESPVDNEES
ncbi:MAG TPA: hypothetical protein EYG50_08755 [Cycloclasticus sp.]|jgi:hypothetical protein|nr:hypothetical protein [Cycloclasticus sp.]HIL92807.1 hypothetical protein [Cycloclasticus sp.]